MPEQPGFNLCPIDGRSMVHLRVRPSAADAASSALQLPQALQWQGGDPSSYWLGPELWLLTSDEQPAGDIIAHIDQALSGQLHAATDMSSNYRCFELSGPASRTVLAMGCGIDLHPGAFSPGECVRTNFAQVLLLIVATGDQHFELYVDRSQAGYLSDWISAAGEDPLTRDSSFR